MRLEVGRHWTTSHVCCRGWDYLSMAEEGASPEVGLGLEERQPTFMQEIDEAMALVREDVCDWLTSLFKLPPEEAITSENFIDRVDDGVLICLLAKLISEASEKEEESLKLRAPRCRRNATPGSWFARDNIANFLKWCRSAGLRDEVLFETEGLVMHSEEKNVILTLLDLARMGADHGMEMPRLVRMEREIDREQRALEKAEKKDGVLDEETQIDCTDGLVEKVIKGRPKTSGAPSPLHNKNSNASNVEDKKSNLSVPDDESNNNNNNSQGKASESQSIAEVSSSPKESEDPAGTAVVLTSAVDVRVHELADGCKCTKKFTIERLREGTYLLNGRMCFLRLFKDNVMVRVGGGWLTISQYLYRHDPCRIINVSDTGRPRYMVARGRYKSHK